MHVMLSVHLPLLLLISFFSLNNVDAIDIPITKHNTAVCEGMKAGRKLRDSFISLGLDEGQISHDSPVSVAIFNYKDHKRIGDLQGMVDSDGMEGFQYTSDLQVRICDKSEVEKGNCREEDLDQFILYDYEPSFEFLTYVLRSPEDTAKLYNIEKDGYYCLVVNGLNGDGVAHFNNYYGKLSMASYQLKRVFGWLVIAHFVVTGLFAKRIWKFRVELLRIQKLLLVFLGLLTIHAILRWSAYKVMNVVFIDSSGPAKLFLFICSISTVVTDVFTMYLMVLISLGQGVVYSELSPGKLKWYKYLLAVMFICNSYNLIQFQFNRVLTKLTFIAGIVGLTIYVKVFRAFRETMKYLKQQGETVKYSMYQKLGRIILIAYILTLVNAFYEVYRLCSYNDLPLINVDYICVEVVLVGIPAMVDFLAICSIVYLWRPKETSYLLALSKQLPTDAEAVLEEIDNGLLPSDDEHESK